MGYQDEFLEIDTPENVAFDYVVAGLGSRFLAALIDAVPIFFLQVVVFFTLFLILSTQYDTDEILNSSGWAAAVLGLISFIFLWGYYIFFEMLWNGQSPGKRVVGLRVIRTDGMPVTLTETLIRNLVRLVDFLPFLYGAGIVTMFINQQSRRLGDLAAGTLVVFDNAEITLESLKKPAFLPSSMPRLGDEEDKTPQSTLPIGLLTDRDIFMIEDYFRRRYDLSNRDEIVQNIVKALHRRMNLPVEPMTRLQAERWLAEVLRAHSSTTGNGHPS